MEVKLWRAIRNHRKLYPSYISEQQAAGSSQNEIVLDEMNNRIEINTNIQGLTSSSNNNNSSIMNNSVLRNSNLGNNNSASGTRLNRTNLVNNNNINNSVSSIVPDITVHSGSNCSSFDSAATTSSDDYESCNGGGGATSDERMDL